MSEKQKDGFFLELFIFAHSAFQKWVKGEGGIWEDLSCTRVAAGAMSSGLEVGDESLVMTRVNKRNSHF